MIKKLNHHELEEAIRIHIVFQLSYSVEAKLLGVTEFPPLKRSIENYQNSKTTFYGFFENNALAGVIETEEIEFKTHINSLVVNPKCFRRGIGKQLVNYVFNTYTSGSYIVETGVLNTPAIQLYKTLGFIELKQWHTDFGIRKVQYIKT
ncbi:GNAT family N-acetyltransferase [uncultured Formosa sp.]|uniref:GNAT family N-acetyltransferase n=1 Tax=uncultured Formosa sp. TaxID=255435 RepID=UPI00260CECCE|nr:GNAT family N-acetyltransferase [uncultured Formosa sp.]